MKAHNLPPQIREALHEAGLPWSLVRGGKHIQVRLCGHLVGILPSNMSKWDRGAGVAANTSAQIRRKAAELKALS